MLSPSAFIILASGKIKHTHRKKDRSNLCAADILDISCHLARALKQKYCLPCHTYIRTRTLIVFYSDTFAIAYRASLSVDQLSSFTANPTPRDTSTGCARVCFFFFFLPLPLLLSLFSSAPSLSSLLLFFNVIFLQFRSLRFVSTRSVAVVIFYINWHWGSACHVGPGAAARGAHEMPFMLYVPVNCSL